MSKYTSSIENILKIIINKNKIHNYDELITKLHQFDDLPISIKEHIKNHPNTHYISRTTISRHFSSFITVDSSGVFKLKKIDTNTENKLKVFQFALSEKLLHVFYKADFTNDSLTLRIDEGFEHALAFVINQKYGEYISSFIVGNRIIYFKVLSTNNLLTILKTDLNIEPEFETSQQKESL